MPPGEQRLDRKEPTHPAMILYRRAVCTRALYCAAALALATAAVMAMLGPARRGANSDPLEALRWE